MNSIFSETLSVIADTNMTYRASKQPKFIRKIIRNKRLSRISKVIEKISSFNILDREFLSDVLYYILNNFDGECYHIKKVKYNEENDSIGCILEIPVVMGTSDAITAVITVNDTNILVSISYYKYDKTDTIKFYKECKELYNDFDKVIEYKSYPWKYSIEEYAVLSYIVNILMKDISLYLEDAIKRAERVDD